MEFSILISATGNLLDDRYYHETTLSDILNACKEAHERNGDAFSVDEPSEPGHTEYSYLAIENIGYGDKSLHAAAVRALADQRPKDPERFAEWAVERWGIEDSDLWWATCCDIQASGILSRPEAERLLDRLGAVADSVETLGTLGGPANPIGIAPDIVYEVESSAVIVSIRVTPLLDVEQREGRWERVKKAVLALHGDYSYPKAAV